jgi:hypothetical protein
MDPNHTIFYSHSTKLHLVLLSEKLQQVKGNGYMLMVTITSQNPPRPYLQQKMS